MSEKVAHIAEVVAENVRLWRKDRGLDQQALADRLAEIGWNADRTTVVRIETGARKVTVEDLVLIAVALNVPVPVLMLPVIDGRDVALTASDRKGRVSQTNRVNRWRMWEWMLGNHPLPGRHDAVSLTAKGMRVSRSPFGDEWRSGAEPLWMYERVRVAQIELGRLETGEPGYVGALQRLLDAVHDMETAGYAADDLLGTWAAKIVEHGLRPSERPRRYNTLDELDASRER